MFTDYTLLVLSDYQRKKDTNIFSLNLIQPTPAKLKEECLIVCNERYQKKDERALKAFFGEGADKTACLQAIKRCETDKFKPLVNFLRQQTATTEDKNIELLAWLIDFDHRPYELGKRYDVAHPGEEAVVDKQEEEVDKEAKPEPAINEAKDKVPTEPSGQNGEKAAGDTSGPVASKFKTRNAVVAVLILVIIGIITYRVASNGRAPAPAVALTGHEACMYWSGDHYQQVSCSQKLGDTMVIAMDSAQLINFKKITQPDTITTRSKGMVWYVKINGAIEFYTSDGYHPINRQLRLRPITDYIIRKYIHPNLVSE